MTRGMREAPISCRAQRRILLRRIADAPSLYKNTLAVHPIGCEVIQVPSSQGVETPDKEGQSVIVMSRSAFDHFTVEQKSTLAEFGTLLPVAFR